MVGLHLPPGWSHQNLVRHRCSDLRSLEAMPQECRQTSLAPLGRTELSRLQHVTNVGKSSHSESRQISCFLDESWSFMFKNDVQKHACGPQNVKMIHGIFTWPVTGGAETERRLGTYSALGEFRSMLRVEKDKLEKNLQMASDLMCYFQFYIHSTNIKHLQCTKPHQQKKGLAWVWQHPKLVWWITRSEFFTEAVQMDVKFPTNTWYLAVVSAFNLLNQAKVDRYLYPWINMKPCRPWICCSLYRFYPHIFYKKITCWPRTFDVLSSRVDPRNDNFCDCPDDCADEDHWTCASCGLANGHDEKVDIGAHANMSALHKNLKKGQSSEIGGSTFQFQIPSKFRSSKTSFNRCQQICFKNFKNSTSFH